jgi:hypothetical protein
MIRRTWSRIVLAIAAGSALALAAPALPAVSQVSPPSPPRVVDVELLGVGQLQARGAAVVVPVQVTCSEQANEAFVSVQVTQRKLRKVTTGTGGATVDCTGMAEVVEIAVTPFSGSRAFGPGSAFAQANLTACFEFRCFTDTASGPIFISR